MEGASSKIAFSADVLVFLTSSANEGEGGTSGPPRREPLTRTVDRSVATPWRDSSESDVITGRVLFISCPGLSSGKVGNYGFGPPEHQLEPLPFAAAILDYIITACADSIGILCATSSGAITKCRYHNT